VLLANIPVLKRLANTIFPLQSLAASLAVQATIMQIILATRNFDYVGREIHCAEAVRFGHLSGNLDLLAAALEWQGGTYIYCHRQPQTAIPLLNDALARLNSDALLSRSGVFIDLAVAYAMDKTQEDYETKAREYAELARMTMPDYPELDLLYPCIQYGQSELDQLEGKMYLYLAKHSSNRNYAESARDAFEKSISKQAMNQAYLGQALIHKADAARALGERGDFVKCLEQGIRIAIEINSMKRSNQANDVMRHIPNDWKHETSVQNLQKELSHAIVVARR
jgi:hypothetical protein